MAPRLPLFLVLTALVGISTGIAAAQTPNLKVYSTRNGLPQDQVLAVHQDSTGYLWLGTYGGLSRYDAQEFRTWTSDDGLVSNAILSLAEDSRGLLVGTVAGLCRRKDERFECPQVDGMGLYRVDGLWADVAGASKGEAWAATSDGVLLIEGDAVRRFGLEDGLPSSTTEDVLFHRGQIFVTTSRGLAVFEPEAKGSEATPGRFRTVDLGTETQKPIHAGVSTPDGLVVLAGDSLLLLAPDGPRPLPLSMELPGDTVGDLALDPFGGIWMATSQGAFLRRDDGELERLSRGHGPPNQAVYSLEVDREDNLWLGTDLGLVKKIPGPFVTFVPAEDIPDRTVRALATHPERPEELWLGTRHGLFRGIPGTFASVDVGELPDPRIYAVAFDDAGRAWIGSRSGLVLLEGASTRRWSPEDGLTHPLVLALLPDSTSRGVWVGTAGGLAFVDEADELQVFEDLDTRLPIMALERGPDGRVWAGLHSGGVAIYDVEPTSDGPVAVLRRRLGAAEGLTDFAVWSLDSRGDGSVWIGTNGAGAFGIRLREDDVDIERLTVEDGLINNFVWQVLWDDRDRLWLFTNRGLDRFDPDRPEPSRFDHFDGADGLPTLEGAAGAILEDPRGQIWLGTSAGLVRFEPSAERRNTVPPRVVIQRVTDGSGRELGSGQSLDPGGGTFTVKLTALTYRHEDRTRFRYRLLGLDEAPWSLPFAEHSINFVGLGPGNYRLEVEAKNESGLWSREPAVFEVTVLSGFWDRTSVRVAGAVLLLLAIFALTRLLLHRSERERRRLESLVAERTLELERRNESLAKEIKERQKAETEHRRLGAQMRQSEKMEAVGRLAGGVAHDFNNLLTTISGYGELLGHQLEPDSSARADLAEIQNAAGRAARLTQQLLAFSRKQEIAPTLLSMNQIVEEVTRMLQRLIGEHIDFRPSLEARPDCVRCDRGQLEQILVNLVLNARDSMAEGGVLSVETRTERLEEETTDGLGDPVPPGRWVVLEVRDQGHGMDEEVMSRIFEPFFTTKGETEGVGLGLATVYGAVRQNQGYIHVRSVRHEGTSFVVRFPFCDEQPFDGVTSGTFPAMPEGVGLTVLVVEDEATVRALISNILKRLGYTVLEAVHGRDAVKVAAGFEGRIHLMITDMVMPEMDGRALAERLAVSRPEMKVLFISGYPDDYLSRRGLLPEGRSFLNKPFSPRGLAKASRSCLEL